MKKLLLFVLNLLIVCSHGATGQKPTQRNRQQLSKLTLLPGSWELNYISGPRIAFDGLYPKNKPTLILNASLSEFNGNSSCNGYGGKVTVKGSKITFGDAIATMMACEGNGEQVYFKTLKQVTSYNISPDGNTLNLLSKDIAVMRFARKNKDESDGHNSAQSLDWPGTYRGITPCADCEGIETTVSLEKNRTFQIQRKYLGKKSKPFQSKGNFTWRKDGNSILLKEAGNSTTIFRVGEDHLVQLDQQGNTITGSNADKYILTRQSPEITEKYWKLIDIGGKPLEKNDNREPHIILKARGGRFNGHGGCNVLNGQYELQSGNRISFSKIVSTEMACQHTVNEQQLIKVLQTATRYTLKGETLLLSSSRNIPLAKFEVVYLK
ncbi:META domain-containing protein [Dyadobacter diqingensis]|uniref:META domain-containing protein n=1 Tax=Dyadobacter diqingensis TaxID=2938121 RepID=UPI0020C266CD|nr:META domain-containing protein [Dyadobacter diqingensis]